MHVRVGLAFLLVFGGVGTVQADGRCTRARALCSATWQMQGKCEGIDLWNRWKVTGQTNPEGSLIGPWLDFPVKVVGYELTKLANPPRKWWQNLFKADRPDYWFMVGSTIQPDAMLWLGPGESHTRIVWPDGLGQYWPAKAKAKPIIPSVHDGQETGATGDLIDVHGSCFGGEPVTLFLTVYYTPLAE